MQWAEGDHFIMIIKLNQPKMIVPVIPETLKLLKWSRRGACCWSLGSETEIIFVENWTGCVYVLYMTACHMGGHVRWIITI